MENSFAMAPAVVAGVTFTALALLAVARVAIARRSPRAARAIARRSPRTARVARMTDESGEGVISMAIAVLIVAALGALIWVGFQRLWNDAEQQIQEEVNQIGG